MQRGPCLDSARPRTQGDAKTAMRECPAERAPTQRSNRRLPGAGPPDAIVSRDGRGFRTKPYPASQLAVKFGFEWCILG